MATNKTCQKCGSEIQRENYKGMNFFAHMRKRVEVTQNIFQFFMQRVDITKEHPADQTRWINTQFQLCNACASDVFDYAQGKTASIEREQEK